MHYNKYFFICTFLLIIECLPLYAETIIVPGHYETIQNALNHSAPGDTVKVYPGVYKENIIWPHVDGIKLLGSGDVHTVIDGNNNGSVIAFNETIDDFIDQDTIIDGFKIVYGASREGGGIYCKNSHPTLKNLAIVGNSADSLLSGGGGIYCYLSNPILSNVVLINNSSKGNGAGFYASHSNPTLNNVFIMNNSSYDGNGGGIFLSHSLCQLSDTIIQGNSALTYGGGVCLWFSNPDLNKVTISNNRVTDHVGDGGGMYCYLSNPSLNHVTVSKNFSTDDGGGIYALMSGLRLNHSIISENQAKGSGGGMYYQSSHSTFTHVVVNHNSINSQYGHGGGMFFSDAIVKLINLTISGNSAQKTSGGLYTEKNTHLTIVNSIFWNNNPYQITSDDSCGISISYSTIENGIEGIVALNNENINLLDGNIKINPLFNDDTNHDLSLQHDSPCINTGHPDLDNDGINWEYDPNDQDPDASRLDMGAIVFISALLLEIPPETSEDKGKLEKKGKIQLDLISETDTTVHLISSHPSCLSVPHSINIPAGKRSETFDILINDNDTYDDTKTITITAACPQKLSDSQHIIVYDNELTVDILYPSDGSQMTESLDSVMGKAQDQNYHITKVELIVSNNFQEFVFSNQNSNQSSSFLWMFDTSSIELKNDALYDITINAYNDKDHQVSTSITYGMLDSTITCNLSKDTIIAGEHIYVSGQISPKPLKMIFPITILIIDHQNDEIYGDPIFPGPSGKFTSELSCELFDQEGEWRIQTSWEGAENLKPAKSDQQKLHVLKSSSRLTLSSTSRHIKSGESISISGKLSSQTGCESGLKKQPLKLKLTSPDNFKHTKDIYTLDKFGHYNIVYDDVFTQLGKWIVQTEFAGNDAYSPCFSKPIEIQVVESAGYAIIVQGTISNDPDGLRSYNKTTSFVYHELTQRGLFVDNTSEDDDIMYLNYDTSQEEVDKKPTLANIEYAIVEWAYDKIKKKPANLYLTFIDHGLEDKFFIDPEILKADDLSEWINELQRKLKLETNNNAFDQEIIIVLGFCHSGSFIDNLSGKNRIIITSASENESSYKGPKEVDDNGKIIRDGEYFVSEFFKEIAHGQSINDSFKKAVKLTARYTLSPTASPNSPYLDYSLQHPLLDDNGDGQGSNELSDPKGDGQVSKNVFLGVSERTGNAPDDVYIEEVARAIFLGTGQFSTNDIWARVNDNHGFKSMWVEIKRPDYSNETQSSSAQIAMDLKKILYNNYNEDLDIYEWKKINAFDVPGMYQVFYFAEDDTTSNISALKETRVYKAKSGNHIPEPFQLISPINISENAPDSIPTVSTTFILDWEDAIDPDHHRISYTVLLTKPSTNSISTAIIKDDINQSACLIRLSDGIKDLSHYYWKVRAIDEYGAIRESETWEFKTDNNKNPPSGSLNAYVFDEASMQPVNNAEIIIGNMSLMCKSENGYYLDMVPPGEYHVIVSAPGYYQAELFDLEIPFMDILTKHIYLTKISPYDKNKNGDLDIGDVIICLKVLANIEGTSDYDNQKLGLKDIIFIIREAITHTKGLK